MPLACRTLARALCVTLILVVCGSAGLPARAPDVTGTPTRVDPTGGSVLVEERPADTSGSLKAALTITAATRIWTSAAGRPEAIRSDELRAGDLVRAWFSGPVRESYPVQADAEAIEVIGRG